MMRKSDDILPYFSRSLIETLRTRNSKVSATLLSADIVGFTAMSRELARSGKEGAEEVTAIANRYLTSLIEIIDQHGGDVLLFVGDALIVAFHGKESALHAARCGLEIQEAMRTLPRVETSRGTFEIGMRVGIASGDLHLHHTGTDRRHFLIRGESLASLSAAEEASQPGQVVVSHSTRDLLGDQAIFTPCNVETDLYLLASATQDGGDRDMGRANVEPEPGLAELLLAYLPPELERRIGSGSLLEGQHRPAAILFAGYHDSDESDELDMVFYRIDACVGRFGGTLIRNDFTKRGPRFLVLFGALQALEDTAFRAVQCAVELRDSVPSDIALRQSVCHGQVFAGEVGADTRKEYTVFGDAINLAARLAERALPSEILIDVEVHDRVEGRIATKRSEPIGVKGIDVPVTVHSVESLAEGRASTEGSTPLVGRETEMATFRERLEKSVAGSGQIVTMSGAAGIGKTRLVQELLRMAGESGMRTTIGHAQPHSISRAYASWTEIVESLLDLQQPAADDEKLRHVETILEEVEPGTSRWMPLLTDIIDLPVDESDVTRSLAPELRQPRVYRLILDLLLHVSKRGGLAVVFEDAHWMDAESQEFLLYLAGRIEAAPILLVVSSRPGMDLTLYEPYAHHAHLTLDELGADASGSLLAQSLGLGTISSELSDLVRERAQGNPLFVRGIAESLLESDLLVRDIITGEHRLDTTRPDWTVPENLTELILGRLDRLPGDRGRLIREASVIGSTFDTRMLHAISRQDLTFPRLTEEVDALVQSGLLTVGDRECYQFAHALVQEAAYDTLPFALRRELQEAVAGELERLHADDLTQVYDRLAHHYLHSDRREKALEYCERAADRAKGRCITQAAIDYYGKAIDLAEGSRKALLLFHRAHILRRVGDIDAAMADAENSKRIAESCQDHDTIARARFLLGLGHFHSGDLDKAAECFKRAAAETRDEKEWIQYQLQIAGIEFGRGRTRRARELTEQVLKSARGLDDPLSIVAALISMGSHARSVGEPNEAIRYWAEGLEIARGHDLRFTTRLLGHLSSVWIYKQDYKTAYRYANESLELTREIGDPNEMVDQLQRMALLKKVEGHFEEAIAIHEERLRISREIGRKHLQASTLEDIGQVELDAGRDPADAIPKLVEARTFYEDLGYSRELANCWNSLARAHYLLGDLNEAVSRYHTALEISNEIEDCLLPECHCGLGMISVDRGNLIEARGHIRRGLEEAWQAKDRLQTARTLIEFGRLESAEGNDDLAARYLIHADQVNTGFDLAGPEIDRGRELLGRIAGEMGDAYEVFKRKVEEITLEQVVERALEQ